MNNYKHKKVEENLLRVYRKVSPSKITMQSKKEFNRFYQRRLDIMNSLSAKAIIQK